MSNVYWVYLRPDGSARIHVVGCGHAPDENGHAMGKGSAVRWKGPFSGHEEAWATAKNAGTGDVLQCPFCERLEHAAAN